MRARVQPSRLQAGSSAGHGLMVRRIISDDEDSNDTSFDVYDIEESSNRLIRLPSEKGRIVTTVLLSTFLFPFWALWILFLIPGKFLLWKEYYFPNKGKVYATGRRRDNSTVAVIYSVRFWFVFALICSPLIYAKMHWPKVQNYLIQFEEKIKQASASTQTQTTQNTSAPAIQNSNLYQLPSCSDSGVTSEIKSIISNAEKVDLSSVEISQISQTDSSQQNQITKCTSKVTTSSTSFEILYKISWKDQDSGQWYVQVYHD